MTIKKLFAYLIVIESCFGTFTSSNADSLYIKSSSGETYECPPLPPVFVDGVLTSWVDAYGSLPFLLLPDGSLLGSDSKNPPRSGEPPVPPGVVTPASDTNTVNFQINWEQIRYNINTNLSGSILTNNPPLDSVITNRMLRLYSLNSNLQANLYYPPKVDIIDLETKAMERREILEYSLEPDVPLNLNLYLVGKETHSWGTSYVLWVEGLPDSNNGSTFPDEQDVEFFAATDLASGNWKLVHFDKTSRTISSNIQEYNVYLNDDPERVYFTVFPLRDTDEDYLSDGVEKLIFKSGPENCDSDFSRDSDGNGTPDYSNKANNWICDGDEDLDGDGVSNADELARGTDPFVAETTEPSDFGNNDFLPSWAKRLIYIYTGVDNPSLSGDSDSDGINDYTELVLGRDPTVFDTIYSPFQRADSFAFQDLTLQRVVNGNTNPDSVLFVCPNILTSFMQMEIHRGTPINGVATDTIYFGAAFNPNTNLVFNITEPDIKYFKLSKEILGSQTCISSNTWSEATLPNNSSTFISGLTYAQAETFLLDSLVRSAINAKEIALLKRIDTFSSRIKYAKRVADIRTEMIFLTLLQRDISQAYSNLFYVNASSLLFYNGAKTFFMLANIFDFPPADAFALYVWAVRYGDDPYEYAQDLALYLHRYLTNVTGYNILALLPCWYNIQNLLEYYIYQ